ncbi:MAG: DUF4241 domain-containing protein [Actinomycetaceae bacterium]|nr:DUF4241 domain-containing protein [Actinomycetaceae bacterium]
MAIEKFYALTEGTIPSPFDPSDGLAQETMNLRVVDLGTLKVSTGTVVACDPFVTLLDGPQFSIPNGEYPVKVTIADVSQQQDGSHQREAYLSVILGPGEAAAKEPIPALNDDDVDDNGYAYVGVDSGTIAFADAGSVKRYMPPETERDSWEDIFDSDDPNAWFTLMDSPEHYHAGIANIVLPKAENGENLALSHSGWGDGGYPVVLTRDKDGNPIGLHIDLELWAEEDDEE